MNYHSNTVSKIRTRDMAVVQTVETNDKPIGIAYDATTRKLWVACYSGSIMIFRDARCPADQRPAPAAGRSGVALGPPVVSHGRRSPALLDQYPLELRQLLEQVPGKRAIEVGVVQRCGQVGCDGVATRNSAVVMW